MNYFIWVLGCAMNYSDAERVASVLKLLGYTETKKEEEADLIITVACSVRQSAIDRIYGKAKFWSKLKLVNRNLKLILTGCVLGDDQKRMKKIFDAIIPIHEMGRLQEIINTKSRNINNKAVSSVKSEKSDLKQKSGDYLQIAPRHDSPFRAFVPIMTGCDNFCSYCAVPYTRGREKSRGQKEILSEIRGLIEKGYKEITLLGQNVNSYKRSEVSEQRSDKKRISSFVELIKEIDEIKGNYRVYFYSNHPKDMSDALIDLMPKLNHFPAYIHLPLQSGSDNILAAMNRHYTKKSYLDLVGKIKKSMPDLAITTDVMVGFPGETEEDFLETLRVMETVGFDMAFIAQYSERPMTKSAKLDDNVSKTEKKSRAHRLLKNLKKSSLKKNTKLVGKIEEVLIDEIKKSTYFGRTASYKVVEIENQDTKIQVGHFYKVKIREATPWKLFGTILS